MKRAVTLAVAALLLLAAPASAFAAGTLPAPPARVAEPAIKGTPVTPSGIDVQFWPEETKGATTIVVVAVVPTSAPLPAAISMPLPAGAKITWAGEISNGGKNDVQRQPDVSKDKRTVTITTQASRFVQYEAQYKPYAERDGRHRAELDWVQSGSAGSVGFAFRLPGLASDIKSTPKPVGGPEVNDAGAKLYTLPTQKLADGQTFKLAVDYVYDSSDLGLQTKQGPDVLLISLFGALGLVAVALVVVMTRNRRSV